jgi:hypothetical protein
MNLRGAARTFCLHDHAHGSHLTLSITNDLDSICRTQDDARPIFVRENIQDPPDDDDENEEDEDDNG